MRRTTLPSRSLRHRVLPGTIRFTCSASCSYRSFPFSSMQGPRPSSSGNRNKSYTREARNIREARVVRCLAVLQLHALILCRARTIEMQKPVPPDQPTSQGPQSPAHQRTVIDRNVTVTIIHPLAPQAVEIQYV